MKQVYTVQSQGALESYQEASQRLYPKLEAFLDHLKTEYQVTELPRCIVWTDRETATHLISDIPIPAYTNDYRTVFCPDLEVWRELYLKQLDCADNARVRAYYEMASTENHILQILGHEFVHHSGLFLDEAYEQARWFEEGMCEYISRKFFLTEQEFAAEAQVNSLLAEQYQKRHGEKELEAFDASAYEKDHASIFNEYWCSFLAVEQIVEQFHGDVMAVFDAYHRWFAQDREVPLSRWFSGRK